MKLLLDENLSSLHAELLRSLGHDAVSIVELGLSGAEDPVVREAAIKDGRTLITLDGDFANVLRFPPADTPGVIRLRIHPPIEAAVAAALRTVIITLTHQQGVGYDRDRAEVLPDEYYPNKSHSLEL